MLENLRLPDSYDGMIFLHEAAKNPPILHPHRHLELECNLVVQGEITYVVGSKRFNFKEKYLLWLFPDQVHQLVDRSPDAVVFVLVFTPDLIARACRGDRYRVLGKPGHLMDGEAILSTEVEEDSFRHLCETMHSLLPGEVDSLKLNQELGFGLSDGFSYHHEDPDWLNAGLRQLLLRCWREQDNHTTAPGETSLHPAVSRALVLLQESGGEIPSALLSKQCGVTGPHLSRIFHREVGVPIRRYRSTVRLARFWELFRGPLRLTLMEAALEAGFGSYTQFFRVFREAYGCSPRALLKREESKGLAHPGKEKSAP